MTFDGKSNVGFKLYDSINESFILPYQYPFPFTKTKFILPPYDFGYNISGIGEPFYLKLFRNSTNETFFDTKGPILLSNQYLQISTKVKHEKIYGFGERTRKFLYKSGYYSIWNKDQPGMVDVGLPNGETYGTHPMYLRREQNGTYHVGFFRNSNGMQIEYNESDFLTFKTSGGILEFKYFLGQTPEQAIKLYHSYINGYSMHPFWAQGYHQCKWGYNTSEVWMQVWQKMNENQLPIDAMWLDIDYMQNFQDFTINTQNFNVTQMKIVTNLSSPQGVHWVPIIDAGIAINSLAAKKGVQQNVFIQSATYNTNLIGCVWPGKSYFVDFNHPMSSNFWAEGLVNLTKNYDAPIPSGIWIDMDEFSNFNNGEVSIDGECKMPYHKDKDEIQLQQNERTLRKKQQNKNKNKLSQIEEEQYPFYPCGPLFPYDQKTLSMNATHYNDQNYNYVQLYTQNLTEYNFHNMNGFLEGIATNQALQFFNYTFPFILSRSTMFGAGKYMQHWTGDNLALWSFLKLSISQIFNFQLFGIPMVGADICGFFLDTTAELCARWMQVGMFYPFARNHASNTSISHEPYAFPNHPYVLESSRQSMRLRYSLLKYYYHLFVRNNGTGTVFRPLFFEFPNDESLSDLDTQFMLGDTLMVAPVLVLGDTKTNTTTIPLYVPLNSIFYDFYTGQQYKSGNYELIVPFNATSPLYIQQGKIVHYQNQNALRSRFLNNTFQLAIAFNQQYYAEGTILSINNYNNDTFINQTCINQNCLLNITAQGIKNTFTFKLTLNTTGVTQDTLFDEIYVNSLTLYGIYTNKITNYKLNNPWKITNSSSITVNILI